MDMTTNNAPISSLATCILSIEKMGRNGKTVTVLDRLPRNEPFLKDLSRKLKMRCGVGGTYRLDANGGRIEIQGDKRAELRRVLPEEKIQFKG